MENIFGYELVPLDDSSRITMHCMLSSHLHFYSIVKGVQVVWLDEIKCKLFIFKT